MGVKPSTCELCNDPNITTSIKSDDGTDMAYLCEACGNKELAAKLRGKYADHTCLCERGDRKTCPICSKKCHHTGGRPQEVQIPPC